MKDTLKRMLGITPAPAQAEQPKEDVTMEVTEASGDVVQAVAEAPTVDVAELQASLAASVAALAEANSKIAELTADVAAAVEFNAARAKAAADAALAVRKEKIVAAVGTEKADALMTATASMDDGAFDAVMSAVATTQVAEANAALFKEVGI